MNSKGEFLVQCFKAHYSSLNCCSRVLLETNAPVYFGLIPKEHWVQPAWIDEDKAEESRKWLKGQNIIYGGAHLCPDTILATKTILNIWQIAHPIEICAASILGLVYWLVVDLVNQ